MTIYTGIADENGDFTIPFSQNYTGGQKVTVKASRDGAEKTIDIFAPSDALGGGVIQFSGTLNDFPKNIGVISLSPEIVGNIENSAFSAANSAEYNIFKQATGLEINGVVENIGNLAFSSWSKAASLVLPSSLKTIGSSAFTGWSSLVSLLIPATVTTLGSGAFSGASSLLELNIPPSITSITSGSVFAGLTSCKKVSIPSTMTTMSAVSAFADLTSCDEIVCAATTPPPIASSCFRNLKATCVIKVPVSSVDAYKTATNWSTYASQIQAI